MSVDATQTSASSNANSQVSGRSETPNAIACARYVGRVGALAVALGVGVAAATGGTGLAWADPDSGSGSSGGSHSSGASGGDPNASSGQGGDSENGDDSSDDPDRDAPAMTSGNPGSTDTSVNDAGQSTDTTELVEQEDDEDEIVDEVDEDEIVDEVDDDEIVDEDEMVDEVDDEIDGLAGEGVPETEPGDAQRDSGMRDNISSDADPVARRVGDLSVGREAVHSDADELTVQLDSGESSTNWAALAVEGIADGGEEQPSAMFAVDERSPAPMPALMGSPTTIMGMAGTFVAAVLSPFLAPRPVAPTESPMLLAVMAWARREWQHILLNKTPHGVVDTITTSEDAEVTVDVITGADPEEHVGDVVTVTEVTQPQHGTVTVNGGTLTYTPNANFHGTDTFSYTISDEDSPLHIHGLRGLWGVLTGGDALHTETVTVAVTVEAVADAPVAVDDDVSVGEDSGPSVIDVLGNDSAVEGDELTVTGVGAAENGTVSLVDGVLTYTPDADFTGADSFTYTVSDDNGGTATATVHVTVNPVPDAPVAVDDTYTIDQDTTLSSGAPGVLGNDDDVDGDALTAILNEMPVNGSVVLQGDGSFIYTPNAGFHGTDSFTYTVLDGNGATATATVTVKVEAKLGVITFDDGAIPSEVFTTDDPTRIFVLTGSELRVVNPTTGEWLDTVELGAIPWSMTISPDRRYAYVGTYSGGTDFVPVRRIDIETGTSTEIGGVRQPAAMVISPDGGTLHVTNNQDGTVSVIDTATGAYRIINTGLQSSAIAVSEDGTTLYVGSIVNDVRVVDIATGDYTILPTGAFDGMSADQSITVVGNRAYVTDGLNNKLAVIDTDTNTIIGSYDVGARPTSVTAVPGGQVILVASGASDSITVIAPELGGVIGELEVGNSPTDIDVADGFVYVTTSDGIEVIPVEQVEGFLDLPALEV